jgi:hypothetical protein
LNRKIKKDSINRNYSQNTNVAAIQKKDTNSESERRENQLKKIYNTLSEHEDR